MGLGGSVIEDKWLGNRRPHRVTCPKGHECAPRPDNVLAGKGLCLICVGRSSADAWRRFQERVGELGGAVIETKWLGSMTPHRVVCAEGHVCASRPGDLLNKSTRGLGCACARKAAVRYDSTAAWTKFRTRVEKLGGVVIETKWLGTKTRHRVVCAAGHTRRVLPDNIFAGKKLCQTCAWSLCDALYVIENTELGTIKLGITNGNGELRLRQHQTDGFTTVLRFLPGLADAAVLEQHVLATLKAASVQPVRGREYFDRSALAVILDIVDNWQRAT